MELGSRSDINQPEKKWESCRVHAVENEDTISGEMFYASLPLCLQYLPACNAPYTVEYSGDIAFWYHLALPYLKRLSIII